MNLDLFAEITGIINRILVYDRESLLALARFEGKRIAIELDDTDTSLYLKITSSGLSVDAVNEMLPDVSIRGTPVALIKYLLMGVKRSESIHTGALEVSGDVSLAQNIQSVFKNLDIDWQEPLSKYVGDSIAHKTGRLTGKTVSFINRTNELAKNNMSEFLRYETDMLIDGEELNEFCRSVDKLRDDTERLKIRVNRIIQSGKTGS